MEGMIPRKCRWDRYGVRVQAIPGLSPWDTPGEELARGCSEAPVGLGRGGAILVLPYWPPERLQDELNCFGSPSCQCPGPYEIVLICLLFTVHSKEVGGAKHHSLTSLYCMSTVEALPQMTLVALSSLRGPPCFQETIICSALPLSVTHGLNMCRTEGIPRM